MREALLERRHEAQKKIRDLRDVQLERQRDLLLEQEHQAEVLQKLLDANPCMAVKNGKIVLVCRTYLKRGSPVARHVEKGMVKWYGRPGPEKIRLGRTAREMDNSTRYGVQ